MKKIFKRLKSIKTNEYSSLSSEQQRLTDEMIRNFEMNGANLSEQSKERFIEINKKLTELSIKFDQNVLKDTNNSELYISDEKELGGLSEKIKDQAKRLAKK
jgi:peptidyl-dipeptidase Dcp